MLTKKMLSACAGIVVVCIMALSGCASGSSGSGSSGLKVGPGVDVTKKNHYAGHYLPLILPCGRFGWRPIVARRESIL
jgi:hypothetical protein